MDRIKSPPLRTTIAMQNELDYSIETFLALLKSAAAALINSEVSGEDVGFDDRLDWLREFDAEDLEGMLADIADRGSVENVNEAIHEWHESALFIRSGVLDPFFRSFDCTKTYVDNSA